MSQNQRIGKGPEQPKGPEVPAPKNDGDALVEAYKMRAEEAEKKAKETEDRLSKLEDIVKKSGGENRAVAELKTDAQGVRYLTEEEIQDYRSLGKELEKDAEKYQELCDFKEIYSAETFRFLSGAALSFLTHAESRQAVDVAWKHDWFEPNYKEWKETREEKLKKPDVQVIKVAKGQRYKVEVE